MSWLLSFNALQKLSAAVLIAIFLHGCSDRIYTAGADLKLESDSDDAVVVLGLRLSESVGTGGSMRWDEIDPTTRNFKYAIGLGLKVARFNTFAESEQSYPFEKNRYFVREVTPGIYALNFYSVSRAGIYTRINLRPNTISFEVKRGELLYIGDFLLDLSVHWTGEGNTRRPILNARETKIRQEGHSIAELKEFLKTEYKNLKNPIVIGTLTPFELKAP